MVKRKLKISVFIVVLRLVDKKKFAPYIKIFL